MAEHPHQNDAASRRRSMLPQKINTKVRGSTEHQGLDHLVSDSSQKAMAPPKVPTSQINVNGMMPPPSLDRSRSVRAPANAKQEHRSISTISSRKSSIRRPSSQHSALAPGTGFEGQKPLALRAHSRSASEQIKSAPSQPGHEIGVPGLTGLPRQTSLSRHSSTKDQRPAFSVKQQHYTPKKTAKQLASSVASLPDEVPSADVFELQMELAQLHLIHRSAATVQHQWEQSAKESFRSRFDALCTRHLELKDISYQQQRLVNQLAIVQWSQGRSGPQVAEKIHLLSRNITELCSLLKTEGKYNRILEVFEAWFDQALKVREARGPPDVENTQNNLELVEGIGDGWKAEAMVLERELAYYSREFKAFGDVRSGSSLGRIKSLYSRLVSNLLIELDLIQSIEHEIMNEEAIWVESTIGTLSSDVSSDIRSMPTYKKLLT